jgi:hypothetical protein
MDIPTTGSSHEAGRTERRTIKIFWPKAREDLALRQTTPSNVPAFKTTQGNSWQITSMRIAIM